ncbi:unnamed protein product [Chrysoparadoxa australica]
MQTLTSMNSTSTVRQTAPSGEYESQAMQAVEAMGLRWGEVLGKVNAAVESAGLLIQGRAARDIQVLLSIGAVIAQKVSEDAGKLLGGAYTALQPTLMLPEAKNGTFSPEAQVNISLSLLSFGLNPLEGLGVGQPQLLGALKGFDNTDTRLRNLRRRNKRKQSKPLPARLLGALPSTMNKAADMAYEIEQEVKYDRAGRRTSKLLARVGLQLPGTDKDSALLSRGGDQARLRGGPNALGFAEANATLVVPEAVADDAVVGEEPRYLEGIEKEREWVLQKLQERPELLEGQLREATRVAEQQVSDLREVLKATEALLSAVPFVTALVGVDASRELLILETLNDVASGVLETGVRQELEDAVSERQGIVDRYEKLLDDLDVLVEEGRVLRKRGKKRGRCIQKSLDHLCRLLDRKAGIDILDMLYQLDEETLQWWEELNMVGNKIPEIVQQLGVIQGGALREAQEMERPLWDLGWAMVEWQGSLPHAGLEGCIEQLKLKDEERQELIMSLVREYETTHEEKGTAVVTKIASAPDSGDGGLGAERAEPVTAGECGKAGNVGVTLIAEEVYTGSPADATAEYAKRVMESQVEDAQVTSGNCSKENVQDESTGGFWRPSHGQAVTDSSTPDIVALDADVISAPYMAEVCVWIGLTLVVWAFAHFMATPFLS